MYNYWHGCAENGGKEYLASNQVVGGSNPSGCAKVINDLAHFRKLELSHKSPSVPQKSEPQGGNRWLGNHRRKCLQLRLVCL